MTNNAYLELMYILERLEKFREKQKLDWYEDRCVEFALENLNLMRKEIPSETESSA